MFEVEPLGTKGKKISKWIMISGLILIFFGIISIIVLGLGNLSGSMFSLIFLTILIGLIIFAIGYSGYSGAVLIGRVFTKRFTKQVSKKSKKKH